MLAARLVELCAPTDLASLRIDVRPAEMPNGTDPVPRVVSKHKEQFKSSADRGATSSMAVYWSAVRIGRTGLSFLGSGSPFSGFRSSNAALSPSPAKAAQFRTDSRNFRSYAITRSPTTRAFSTPFGATFPPRRSPMNLSQSLRVSVGGRRPRPKYRPNISAAR